MDMYELLYGLIDHGKKYARTKLLGKDARSLKNEFAQEKANVVGGCDFYMKHRNDPQASRTEVFNTVCSAASAYGICSFIANELNDAQLREDLLVLLSRIEKVCELPMLWT